MSRADFRGAAYALQKLMEAAQDEIDRGERKGVQRVYPRPDRSKVTIWRPWWFTRTFGRRA